MGSALSSFCSLMDSVLSSFCSPSLLPLPPAPPASPPTPPTPPEIKYDVFLSFRGEDTRNNFTSHLDKAFRDKGIDHFIDYQLRSGDEISPFLLQTIERSLISVVIFSENYADSRWCLEELVKILECKEMHGQIVMPIFYKIDPTHVRHQTGSYAAAFARHQKRFKKDLDKVQKWRCALKDAANISGSDSRVVVPESALVEKIVEDVVERLNNMPSSDNNKLVGIESRIEKIEAMIGMGDQMNNDIRKVGICGTGGIGKTTLAKAVFDRFYHRFEGFYFVRSVREALEKSQLDCLRQKLHLAILGDGNAYIYNFTRKRLSRRKVLIIFDDVTSVEQVEDLIGDLDCFGFGSRIIITSRNHQVLKNFCRENDIYKVEELCFKDSLELFCRHAFKQNCPKVDYKELSKDIIKKVGGIPLALKVLGSFLFDKEKEVWESSMNKLEYTLDSHIHEVLKISYDGLDPSQKRIFLDIAHFYEGWDINLVKEILEVSPSIYVANDLSALKDACLIIISDNKLMMHDLLRAMAKTIVQQESEDPSKRTRLDHPDEIYDVLINATGTETIEGISWDMSNIGDINLHRCTFENMHYLRFLRFYIGNRWSYNNSKVHVLQDLKFGSIKLTYFEWQRCPLKLLPYFKNLVRFELPDSDVKQLWSGIQQFDHLKKINLCGSKNLIRFPDLKAPKLEDLCLNECTSLIQMPSSFQHLNLLVALRLSSCEKLMNVPELPESLQSVFLQRCLRLQRLPESIQHLTKLVTLDLDECKSLTTVPDCSYLISLQDLYLYDCSKLERLPEIANNFRRLYFSDCTSLFEIPSSFKHLNQLKSLGFSGCKSLTSIPDLEGLKTLKRLTIERCSKLKTLPKLPNSIETLFLEEIPIEDLSISFEHHWTLRELYLSGCGMMEIPESVCCIISLKRLELDRNNFERIPENIINLTNLSFLNISYCERLKVLPKLPWTEVVAFNCTSLQEVSCPSFPDNLFTVHHAPFVSALFVNCFNLDQNSLDNFANDAQWELQQAQSPPCHNKDYQYDSCLSICYPGTEIPEWFDFQSSQPFIDVKLPLDGISCKFLRFALCAVVSPRYQGAYEWYDHMAIGYECIRIFCGDDNLAVDYNRLPKRYKIMGSLGTHDLGQRPSLDYNMRSSHVFIGFVSHFVHELEAHELEINELLQIQLNFRGLGHKVEKCGVRLIVNDDYQSEKCGGHMIVGDYRQSDRSEEDVWRMIHFNRMKERRMAHFIQKEVRSMSSLQQDDGSLQLDESESMSSLHSD